MKTAMNGLVDMAMRMGVKAANEYLTVHELKADPGALTECLRGRLKIKIPEAIKDAKEALDCHMDKIAEMTFAASMAQAGIEAAKEAGQAA